MTKNDEVYSEQQTKQRFETIIRAALSKPRTQMKDVQKVPAKRGRKPKATAPKHA